MSEVTLTAKNFDREAIREATGSDILKLNWTSNPDDKKVYQLGFAIMYNHRKCNDETFKLNDFFADIPQSMGSNCGAHSKGYLSSKKSNFTIPILGGESIPATFVDCTATGSQALVRDCYGIREMKAGSVRIQLNVYGEKSGCNGLPVIHIQVPQKFSTIFVDSYGN